MRAKAVDFEVTYINLRQKPDWFLAISPHGKVPVLTVDERPLFESNAIAEYLERHTGHPAVIVPLASNHERFAPTDPSPTFASDFP